MRQVRPVRFVRQGIGLSIGGLRVRRSGIAFDKFATGHYARLREENVVFHLLHGVDEKKAQAYFLYRLKQSQLANLLFLSALQVFKKASKRFHDVFVI